VKPISAADVQQVEKEHAALYEKLDGLSKRVDQLTQLSRPEQQLLTQDLLAFFNDNILSHAEQETRTIYDQLDASEPSKRLTVTATMRYEHQVIRRRVEAFNRDARANQPSSALLQREAEQLLAILATHFETEDHVIFPAWKALQTGEPA
jgi:hemerythrin-like domain-containing protein